MFSSHKKYSEEVWGVNSTFKPFHVIGFTIPPENITIPEDSKKRPMHEIS